MCILYWQDDPRHSSGSLDDTPRSSGASGIFDLRNLAADSLLPSLLERVAPEDVDRRNVALRRQHRPRALLALYPAPDEVGARSTAQPLGSVHSQLTCIPVYDPSEISWVPNVYPAFQFSSSYWILLYCIPLYLSRQHLLGTNYMLLYLLNQYLLYAYCIVFKQTAFNQPAFIKHLLYMPVFIGHSLCCSVSKSCPALCDPMNYSSPGFPVLHYLLGFAQTHVY